MQTFYKGNCGFTLSKGCSLDVLVAAEVTNAGSDDLINARAFTTSLFVNLDIRPGKIKSGLVQYARTARNRQLLTDSKVEALVGTGIFTKLVCNTMGACMTLSGRNN